MQPGRPNYAAQRQLSKFNDPNSWLTGEHQDNQAQTRPVHYFWP
jgi:hypothetical protein